MGYSNEEAKLYQRELRKQRIAGGLCIICGNHPPRSEVRSCEKCRVERQKRYQTNTKLAPKTTRKVLRKSRVVATIARAAIEPVIVDPNNIKWWQVFEKHWPKDDSNEY